MTLLIQNVQGDIKSWLLMNTNLATADFDTSANKVEEYYRNVYIDNSGGQIAGLQKPKPWKSWKPWKPRKPKKGKGGKGKDYGKDKGLSKVARTVSNLGKDLTKVEKESTGKMTTTKAKEKEKVATTVTESRKATTTGKEKTKATEESHKVHHYRDVLLRKDFYER
eukprot:2461685-Amphidinium_carterae.1